MKSRYKKNYILILVAFTAFLLHSCSPAPIDVAVVEKISMRDDTIVVRASRICDYCESADEYLYFISKDNGQTWEEITKPPIDELQALNFDNENSTVVCLSTDEQICYRITGQEQVDISSDYGATWQVDWQIPVGRKFYMEKSSPYPRPDTVPLDIGVMESNSGQVIIVAMGNQGVLVKSPDGNGNRYAVSTAIPTPYYAADFSEANIVLYYDRIAVALFSICLFLLLSIGFWISGYINSNIVLRKKILHACLPFGVSLAIMLMFYLAAWTLPRNIVDMFDYYPLQVLVTISPLLGFVFTAIWIIVISPRKRFSLWAFVINIGFSVFSFYIFLLSLQLWALGTIAVYENAVLVDWALGIGILLVGVIVGYKMSKMAMTPENQQSLRRGDLWMAR